jgi:hypothetical protein
MMRTFMIAAASAAILALSATAFAQQRGQFGTADEAKAMLVKAVAAVKVNKAKALDMFAKGEGGFLDRDLYRKRREASTLTRIIHDSTSFSSPRRARAPSTSPDLIRIGV